MTTSPTPPRQSPAVATRPVKRSFTLSGHRTSISLEAAFWDALRETAIAQGQSLAQLVGQIDRGRGTAGLSGAVRVWVLDYFRTRATTATATPTATAPIDSPSPRLEASVPPASPEPEAD